MSLKPTKNKSPKTIADFFAKVPSSPKTASCPVCEQQVPIRSMNDHLDQPGGCRRPSSLPSLPNPPEEETEGNHESLECTPDVFSDESDSECSNIKRSYSFEQCAARYFSSSPGSSQDSVSTSPTKRLRASRELSNNPKKFGGVDALSSQGEVSFTSPSPRKRGRGRSVTPKGTPVSSESGMGSSDGIAVAAVKTALLFENVEVKHVAFTQSKKTDPTHIPYYVVNFESTCRCVIDETEDRELFNEEELSTIEDFRQLSLDARKLYIRLFQRKHAWLTKAQVKYEEIMCPLEQAIGELIGKNLFQSGDSIEDLEVLLSLLSSPDLRSLAKEMKVVPKGTQKSDIVQALLSHSRQRCVFFKQNSNAIEVKIRSRAKTLLGSCFKLSEEPRRMFLRILSLYSLSNWWDERENDKGGGQPQQLVTTLLVNQGKLTFPTFEIIRQRKIFRHREDLLKFEEGCALEAKISEAVDEKDWATALLWYEEAKCMFDQVLLDTDFSEHVASLPVFLRRFTLGSVLAYALTKSVEVLERQKQHQVAVDVLRLLIRQTLYLSDYHGHWYERLTLDLDQHLKRPEECLDACRAGLDDHLVREARRLFLCQRVSKVCGATLAKKDAFLQSELLKFHSRPDWLRVKENPKVIIQGKMMSKENLPGAKTVFIYDNGTDNLLCSVEEYVREVYKDRGMVQGLHAEGAVVNTICALLFWEILYDLPVPDAFRCPNQAAPLDFDSDDFYESRRQEIDDRLDEVGDMSDDHLRSYVTETWEKNVNLVSCVNWDLFNGPQHLLGLLFCFTRIQLRGICERLIKNHRSTRSGFPDLTVWSPDTKKCQIIEVKAPNDKLSNKQILWIDYLNKLGVDAFVCHVECIGGKRLSKRSPLKERVVTPPKNGGGDTTRNRKAEGSKGSDVKRRKRFDSGDDFAT